MPRGIKSSARQHRTSTDKPGVLDAAVGSNRHRDFYFALDVHPLREHGINGCYLRSHFSFGWVGTAVLTENRGRESKERPDPESHPDSYQVCLEQCHTRTPYAELR